MGEVKFRVWFPKAKRMLYFDSPEMDNEYDNLTFSMRDEDKIQQYQHLAGHSYIPNDSFSLMQFTGLRDKNNVGIYEGDIVKSDWGRGELIAEIMFEDGAFVLAIPDDCYRDMAGEGNNLHCEIIGNIYGSKKKA